MSVEPSSKVAQRPRPTGTVVFLFTDIEGSTARWDSDRDAMQEALRRHDSMLASAIEAHNGYIFKTIGDAYCAAFTIVRDALEAAADAQRRFGTADWSAINGLRVRMAIHAGDADERSGDYFGPAVNRVARLLSTAHGAQVIVSGVAADLAAQNLPSEMALRHLGVFLLKDLKEPERVYQLTAPGLDSEFKPLRSVDAIPNNLPRQATSFVGREEDAAHIRELLRTSALVTIVGAGGVGKTRIALRVAADLMDDGPDGAWFVNLAPVRDESLVASTILSAVGATQKAECTALESLVEYLRIRRVILVIDNCEHLIVEVAHVIAAIIETCPQVTLLATSREPINVAGEQVYRLPSLDRQAAVRLFVERAKTANPKFALNGANSGTIEEICDRVDGIALAIELAAPRLRTISAEELLRRLNERLAILTGGSRAALPRHQTMRALIDWSYDHLSENEQILMRRLAVFSGGFTLGEVAKVCTDGAIHERDVLDLVSALVDKSMVTADIEDSSERDRLLQTIHEYARERLDASGEATTVLQHHAICFAQAAAEAYAEWDLAPRNDWLERLKPELDNFRSALGWSLEEGNDTDRGAQLAADVFPIFMRMSLLAEAIRWCEMALERNADILPAQAARLQYGLSMLHNNQVTLKGALSAAERAVELYALAADERGLTRALSQLASQYARQGRRDDARAPAHEALERARALGDARLLAATLQRCAFVLEPSEIETARAQFAESVAIFRTLGREEETARALIWWVETEADAGCLERARDLCLEAMQLSSGDSRMYITLNAASYCLALGDHARALPAAREGFALAAQARHGILIPTALAYFSVTLCERDPVKSAQMMGYAHSRFRSLDWEAPAEDRATYEKTIATLKQVLTGPAFAEAFATGSAWDEAHALAEGAAV